MRGKAYHCKIVCVFYSRTVHPFCKSLLLAPVCLPKVSGRKTLFFTSFRSRKTLFFTRFRESISVFHLFFRSPLRAKLDLRTFYIK